MLRKKIAQIRPKKAPNSTPKNYAKRKKISQIRAKKALNTTLKKFLPAPQKNTQILVKKAHNTNTMRRKKVHKFEPKKHLTLSYIQGKKKEKMHKSDQKKQLTLPYKNYEKEKENCTNSSQKST